LFEGGNAWKRPSLHPFQKRAASGRDEVKSPATPAWLSAATVSPPPATETRLPSWVSAAAVLASATVAASNGGVSNAPSGPFQTRGPAGLEHIGQRLDRRRPDVEDHLVGGNFMDVAGAKARRIRRELLCHTTS
jgi:hypothetical protein